MNKKAGTLLLIAVLYSCNLVLAQDTLPSFLVKNAGNNRIIIGWVNTYQNITQLSIQRSFDSLTGYKTILSVADPLSPQNGYVDTKAANDRMFYRLYIQLDKGNYLFSRAKRPVLDTAKKMVTTGMPGKLKDSLWKVPDSVWKVNPFYVKLDSLLKVDSVANPNAVTLKNKPTAFSPSLYVYTARDGFVRITLPDDEKPKKYSIKFFDADQTFLFELKDIKAKTFKLDKTSFYHAGWFHFELYEDGKLLEKHKFLLEKDF